MKRIVACWMTALMIVAGVVLEGIGRGAESIRTPQVSSGELDVVQVRPDFYMIAGAGGNIAVQIGPAGVILVDTGSTQMLDRVWTALQRLTSRRIRYIINTSADAAHVGGNEKLSKAGHTMFGN